MARMLQSRDSTARHFNALRRHARLCKQFPGAEGYAATIQVVYDKLSAQVKVTEAAVVKREDALDDFILADRDLDNLVRTSFEKVKQFDRKNPGLTVMKNIFPEGKFSDIVRQNREKELETVEQLAVRFESLSETHELFVLAAELREQVANSRTVLQALEDAEREEGLAQTQEEVVAQEARELYEENFLNARKEFGRLPVERLFARFASNLRPKKSQELPDTSSEVPVTSV